MWNFIEKQLLGMQWLKQLVYELLSLTGMNMESRVADSLVFFVYDTIKIFILLSVLIFAVSYVQSYFPPERTRKILGRFKGLTANLMGALLGTVTPFCSCSSIPIFIGFASAGVPVGVSLSFLISSPLVDLGAFLLLLSVFGWKIALAYVIVGIVLAVLGGALLDKLGMEDQVEEFIRLAPVTEAEQQSLTVKDRCIYGKNQVLSIIRKVWIYVLVGVSIGAVIHNWIPQEWVVGLLGSENHFSVVLATFVGVPMYADIFGTIPIAEALWARGAGLGTILSFMMAVTALSLPSLIMLKQAVKPKLLGAFAVVVIVGILLIGFGFNLVTPLFC
ncbi:MAG: permease [Oscillospiraceae bacterium]|nr:permease [Oscillospiraceae bacterium]